MSSSAPTNVLAALALPPKRPLADDASSEEEEGENLGGGGGGGLAGGGDGSQPGPSATKRPRFGTPPDEHGAVDVDVVLPGQGSSACEDACCSSGGGGAVNKGKGREVDADAAGAPVGDDVDKAMAVDEPAQQPVAVEDGTVKLESLVDALEDELMCPICSAVLYKPVTIQPGCGHAFCGACLHSYLSASSPVPHVCPSCRTTSTSASHSRIVSTMVDVLVAHAPGRARTQNEKDQADDIWDIGMHLRFGAAPPPPERIRLSECYRPCRHCQPNNAYGWSCPEPVPSIDSDGPHYPLDGPTPPGHFQCASCARLAASEAPGTTSCSICEAHYCGAAGGHQHTLGGDGVCSPQTFESSTPSHMLWGRTALDLSDAIMDGQSDEMMNAFRDNLEEINIFARFIGAHAEHTPAALWAEMLEWIRSDEGKAKGGVKGIFRRTDENIHYSFQGVTPARSCKSCTDDVFACALYEWWERKRPTVLSQLDKEVAQRPDCRSGRACYRQGNAEHAKKFNHICSPAPLDVIEAAGQGDVAPAAAAVPAPIASSPSSAAPAASTSSSSSMSAAAASALPHSGSSSISLDTDHPSSAGDAPVPAPDVGIGAELVALEGGGAPDGGAEDEHDPDTTIVVDEAEVPKLDDLPSLDEPAAAVGATLPDDALLPLGPAAVAA